MRLSFNKKQKSKSNMILKIIINEAAFNTLLVRSLALKKQCFNFIQTVQYLELEVNLRVLTLYGDIHGMATDTVCRISKR